jgi:hypothetical protein
VARAEDFRPDLQPLFGERSSRGAFQVGFEIECLFAGVVKAIAVFMRQGVNLEVWINGWETGGMDYPFVPLP